MSSITREIAESLAEPPTKSTAHMSHQERVDGIQQMLSDLRRLALSDGCIAAAWATEKLESIADRLEREERYRLALHAILNFSSQPHIEKIAREALKGDTTP